MTPLPNIVGLQFGGDGQEPRLSRSYSLRFVGDWGGANFHRICSWLTQEFCDRAGPGSRTSIWSLRDGGIDALDQLEKGEVDLAIATPAGLMSKVLSGKAMSTHARPHLRALVVLPQNDRMVLAVHPKHNVQTFSDLRREKPALRIATSTNDGSNFIGFVARQFMEAHGIPESTLQAWGGQYITAHRPEQCTAMVEDGRADALLQEAIMTPWWQQLVDSGPNLVPLPAEPSALEHLHASIGLSPSSLPKGFWSSLTETLPALDFSDFVLFVRDDMPVEVAYMLTWCAVETRQHIEAQFRHLPPEKSPLSYPLVPEKMSKLPAGIKMHVGAKKYFDGMGLV